MREIQVKSHNLEYYISDKGWNRNIPKIMDNAVIMFVRNNRQNIK